MVGFALALVLCSIFAVQNVSLPGPLALIAPAILLIFYVLVAATYWDLSERLLTAMQKSDPEGTQRSLQTASEWTASSRPRTLGNIDMDGAAQPTPRPEAVTSNTP